MIQGEEKYMVGKKMSVKKHLWRCSKLL